jgi:hypothetical protein
MDCFLCLDSVSDNEFEKIHTCQCAITYHTECINEYLDIPVYDQRCPWCQKLTFQRIYTPEEFEEVRRKLLEHAQYQERLRRIAIFKQISLYIFLLFLMIITIGSLYKS